jgi:UDP-glucose 4-epimerase
MAAAAASTAEATHVEARPGELMRSSLDPSLAAELLGWAPTTAVGTGAAHVLDYFKR